MSNHFAGALTAFVIVVGSASCLLTAVGAKGYAMYAEYQAGITLSDIADKRTACERKLPRNQQCKPELRLLLLHLSEEYTHA